MPKNKVSDLITDQEIAFALLILSGTMTDHRAAEAAGLNAATAAYTKAKPRVRAFMLDHRAAVREQLVQQETENLRRLNQSRERVLKRLWEIADLDPETTRNSMSAQMKAIAMIVAIESLIPDRRAGSAQNRSTPTHPQSDLAAWVREQQSKTAGPQPSPDLAPDEDGPDPGAAADLGTTPGLTQDSSDTISASSAKTTPVSASAPGNRVPSSIEKKPDTLRLRL
jgi:hypothetical protein